MPLSVTAISTCASTPLQHHLHAAARRRELDGVREQVPHDLLQAAGIAGDRSGQPDRGCAPAGCPWRRRPAHRLDRRLDDRERVERLHVEPELARDDAAHVEQIVDELRLDARVALDGLEAGPQLVGAAAGRCAAPGPSRGWRSAACAARATAWRGTRPWRRSCARPRRGRRARCRAAPCAPRRRAAPARRGGRCRGRRRPGRRHRARAARRAR